jgi:hypothetical protein
MAAKVRGRNIRCLELRIGGSDRLHCSSTHRVLLDDGKSIASTESAALSLLEAAPTSDLALDKRSPTSKMA